MPPTLLVGGQVTLLRREKEGENEWGERAEQKRERSQQQAKPNPARWQEKDEIWQMGILHVTCRHV